MTRRVFCVIRWLEYADLAHYSGKYCKCDQALFQFRRAALENKAQPRREKDMNCDRKIGGHKFVHVFFKNGPCVLPIKGLVVNV